jgi:hypothetical protein
VEHCALSRSEGTLKEGTTPVECLLDPLQIPGIARRVDGNC